MPESRPHGHTDRNVTAATVQTGITASTYIARRLADMLSGPPGIGVTRKIQFERRSKGRENTTRAPSTAAPIITMLATSISGFN